MTIVAEVQLTASAKTRMNLSFNHLASATILAREARAIEHRHAGQPLGEHWEVLLANATGAVMMSVAALEGYIAQVQADGDEHFPTVSSPLRDATFALIERASTLEKAAHLSLLNGRSPLDLGRAPGQDVVALIRLRNALVHFQPEWFGEQRAHAKLSQQLQHCFEPSEWFPNEPIFPRAWASYACCKWAIDSARDFIVELATVNGWTCGFNDPKHAARFECQ